ncbi:hypothetical protein BDW68DRAFT_183406 [Aspergillus falconensis]
MRTVTTIAALVALAYAAPIINPGFTISYGSPAASGSAITGSFSSSSGFSEFQGSSGSDVAQIPAISPGIATPSAAAIPSRVPAPSSFPIPSYYAFPVAIPSPSNVPVAPGTLAARQHTTTAARVRQGPFREAAEGSPTPSPSADAALPAANAGFTGAQGLPAPSGLTGFPTGNAGTFPTAGPSSVDAVQDEDVESPGAGGLLGDSLLGAIRTSL